MSYPFIGMGGIGYEKYDAKTIEKMLREGRHIYDDRFDGPTGPAFSFFEDEKFKFDHPVNAGKSKVEKRKVEEFDTFIELAAYVAFYWQDFL